MRPIHLGAVVGKTYYITSVSLQYRGSEADILRKARENLVSTQLSFDGCWDGMTTSHSQYNLYEVYCPLFIDGTKSLTVIWSGQNTALEYVGFSNHATGRKTFTVLHIRSSGTRSWIYENVEKSVSAVKAGYQLSDADINLAVSNGVSKHWVIVNSDELLYINPHTVELLTVPRQLEQ